MLIHVRILIFAIALALGILSLITGLILYFWPHGPRSGQLIIFGMTKLGWSELHTYASILALIVILVHLIVNRTSIRLYFRYLRGQC
ncbi:MAG: DUF4405 domain-containing protein [Archaeoglobaceae archaeon]|nr:DUF4405 domain-containing protein [Archaeoglobales archaeon]